MRKILLIEPNYKNKYPPMGLMKISTYHKMLGDEVTFFKGNLQEFVLDQTYDELLEKLSNNDPTVDWCEHKSIIKDYLKRGYDKNFVFLQNLSEDSLVKENLKFYRNYYIKKRYFEFPKWDRVCITTLFTFHWSQTIDTINFAKKLCKCESEVKVGGIAASVVPKEIEKETGIKPHVGLLDKPGVYDTNDIVIDHLPLDYSILNEIDYIYPENNGYYGYMTRGCINKCQFCAVPILEPKYNSYISIKEQIKYIKEKFGEKRNLLLLDNNVLASKKFNLIIDEIKECGFDGKSTYVEPNQYNVAIDGLYSSYNDKGYIKSIIKQYKKLSMSLNVEKQTEIFKLLKENKLLSEDTAKKENIIKLDTYFRAMFEKMYTNMPKARYVDFNQGIEAKLLTEDKMKKLSEIPVRPLRIAFDDWSKKDDYERAIKLAASYKLKDMSNYLLYNFEDKPIDLYYRLKLNIDLCEELNISIYSFPMKYHPVKDPEYFRNRNYEGVHWNRKYIRSIQAILNATKGKIGRGRSFFEEAFGKNEEEFGKLLYMPEPFIVYRFFYKDNGMTEMWWNSFNALGEQKIEKLKNIVHNNDFNNIYELSNDEEILEVLKFYTIRREDAEKIINKS